MKSDLVLYLSCLKLEISRKSKSVIIKEWLEKARKKLPHQECVYLIRSVLDSTDFQINLPKLTEFSLNRMLELRSHNVPLAKITGKKAFMNHIFLTNFNTLDPRPESEALLENISITPKTICDLGTGTGCLIISALQLIQERGKKCKGLAIDISQQALDVAILNAEIMKISKHITFKLNNWAENIDGHFDLVLANPPYVDTPANPDAEYDPKIAMYGNAETYYQMLKSISFTFYEMLIEVPEYLIDSLEQIIKEFNHTGEFIRVYDSNIFVLKINKPTPF